MKKTVRGKSVSQKSTAARPTAGAGKGPAGVCRKIFLDACEQVIRDWKLPAAKRKASLAIIQAEKERAAASLVGAASLVDTFRLNPKLTYRLHEAARMCGASPEWIVAAALESLITSINDDNDVCGTMAHNYRIDEQNKTRCIVQPVKGGVR